MRVPSIAMINFSVSSSVHGLPAWSERSWRSLASGAADENWMINASSTMYRTTSRGV
jgi:hypothetical protein